MPRPWRRPVCHLAALLAFLIAAAGSPAAAEDSKPLAGADIATLLVGNSIEGTWGASHFRSFFASDGTTLYQPEGQPPEQGHWKVVGDQYCSVADEGDACFNLYRDGDSQIWEDPNSHTRFPSTVIKGKAVPW